MTDTNKLREALEAAKDVVRRAGISKLADGTYFDKDCSATFAYGKIEGALAALAATSEKAERGEQAPADPDGNEAFESKAVDVRQWLVHEHAVYFTMSTVRKLVSLAQLADPPTQPAQADEVLTRIRQVIRETEMDSWRGTVPVGSYKAGFLRIAALTQRPAAPLATDAGVADDSSVAKWVIRAALAWASGNPNSATACKNLLEATRAYRNAAHPAAVEVPAQRPAQGEAGEVVAAPRPGVRVLVDPNMPDGVAMLVSNGKAAAVVLDDDAPIETSEADAVARPAKGGA